MFDDTKKICGLNAFKNLLFCNPPRKNAWSIYTFHARMVFITLFSAGLFLAVIIASRTGEYSIFPGSRSWILESFLSKFA